MVANASPSAVAKPADDIRARVCVAQMRMLFAQTNAAIFAATTFAFALAAYLNNFVAHELLIAWLAFKVLVIVPRIVHAVMFKRRPDDSLKWLRYGRIPILLDGFAWGCAGVFLVPADNITAITVVVATLCGVSAVAAFVLHTDWLSCLSYIAPMQVLPAAAMLWRADATGVYLAFSILIFFTLLMISTRRSERTIVEMLKLRFQNEELTDKLSSALELAREENRAKNEFVANMSHELRTPLHGILGTASVLTSPSSQIDNREGISIIRHCGEHLLGLINNILEYSRFGAKGIDIHPQAGDLAQLVEDTLEMCKASAIEKGLGLSCTFDIPRPYFVMVDSFRLRQILLNLLGNAIKFTEHGAVRVHVSELGRGQGILIRVEDTGVGIEPGALESIFEPFVQADTSNTRKFGGTGLGLSITKSICEAMHGRISCHSAIGRGSTFEASLPLEQLQASPMPMPTVAPPSTEPHGMRGTILLAEDNEVNAVVAEATLKKMGLGVLRAHSGQGVVDRVCQTSGPRPDLVLLDCQMPEMDGFEAARRVREHEAQNKLPRLALIALTANVFPEDRDLCLAAGMDDFLAKPFTDAQLREKLATHLSRSSSATA